jgi:broad specificity phosphatase PhoE
MPPVGTTVIGVRHGEVFNPDNVIYSGLAGFGLSELGRRQARAVGEALAGTTIAALYASPLERAIETAAVIGELTGAEVVPDERLSEWRHWEQFAGMTWDELRKNAKPAWDAYTSDPGAVTSGESLDALADRVESWLADATRDNPAGLVVAVSHLEPLRAILLRKLSRPAGDLFSLQIGLGESVRLVPDPDVKPMTGSALRGAAV